MKRFLATFFGVCACLFFAGENICGQNVIAWGNNSAGQTNVPASATNVIAVAAGSSHSLALRDDGTVISWGSTTNADAAGTNVIAIAAGALHSLALHGDGTVSAWGDNSFGQRQWVKVFGDDFRTGWRWGLREQSIYDHRI